jgi:hypothetical protein
MAWKQLGNLNAKQWNAIFACYLGRHWTRLITSSSSSFSLISARLSASSTPRLPMPSGLRSRCDQSALSFLEYWPIDSAGAQY